MTDVRQRIKRARRDAGYRSQKDFAPVIGVTRETLGKYESKDGAVTIDAMKSIAKATGKPLAWFFLEDNWELVQRGTSGDGRIRKTVSRARKRLAQTDEDLKEIEALVGAES